MWNTLSVQEYAIKLCDRENYEISVLNEEPIH